MFKPKQAAPFFSMETQHFSKMLQDIDLVYPLEKTPFGSILVQEKDFGVIESYRKTLLLFGDKKTALFNFKKHLDDVNGKKKKLQPEWIYLIRNRK